MKRLLSWAIVATMLCLCTDSFADTVYTFTGSPFTDVFGPTYTTSDFIRGTLITKDPLPIGISFFNPPSLPGSFSFTDGHMTIDQDNTTGSLFYFFVLPDGQIENWVFVLNVAGGSMGECYAPGPNNLLSKCIPGTFDFTVDFDPYSGGGSSNQGEWTVAQSVPEPASVVLLLSGMLGLFRVGRKAQ